MILPNTPTLSYIYIQDMLITYKDVVYQIPNSYTNKPYVYWSANTPNELIMSDKILAEEQGRFYLVYNDAGIYTVVPQTEIEISFSEGVSRDLVTSKIIGFAENEIIEGKFATIQTDVNGLKTTVGTMEKDINSNREQISTLTQTANEISAEVSNIERNYSTNEELQALRNNVNIALLEFQGSLGLFNSDVNIFMQDNKLSDTESSKIESYKTDLIEKRDSLNTRIDEVIAFLNSQNKTTEAKQLQTQKESLNTSVSSLLSNIATICADKTFTNTEMTTMVSQFANVNTKINETNNLIDNYIFLEIGGSLVEEISKLVISQGEIKTTVSKTESDVDIIADNIASMNTRITQAESKITNDAIINVVNNRFYTKTEVDNMNSDLEEKVTRTEERIAQAESKITSDAIINTVGSSFYTKTEVDKLNSNLENLLDENITNVAQGLENDILLKINGQYANEEDIIELREEVTSKLEQTSDKIEMSFNTAYEYTVEVDDKLTNYKQEMSTNIRFSDEGIELGKSDSPFKATLDNEKLAFSQNDAEVAYISNHKMYITNAEITSEMQIGKWVWTISPKGNLTLNWRE